MAWTGKVQASSITPNGLTAILTQRFTSSVNAEIVDFSEPVPGSVQTGAQLQAWALAQRAIVIDMLNKRDAAVTLITQSVGT